MNRKRNLQEEDMRKGICKKARECKAVYDNPMINKDIERALGYSLIDRTKTALTSLSNSTRDYLSKRIEAGAEHLRTTYELMRMTTSIK